MTTTILRTAPRRAFTLVEVLVATALIVFIMVILTEAFSAGIGTFRLLKAAGDMQEKLRNTGNLLIDDLRQPHFDGNDKKLSNLFTSPANVPQAGYFCLRQNANSLPSVEGLDGLGIPSLRMPDATAVLCFSVRRNGIQPSDYGSGRIPGWAQYQSLPPFLVGDPQLDFFMQGPLDYRLLRGPTGVPLPGTPPYDLTQGSGTLISLWEEIGWFLTPEFDSNGNQLMTPNAAGVLNSGLPLFTLRRRKRVVTPDDPKQITPNIATLFLNNSNNPANRMPINFPWPNPGTNVNLWGARYAEVSCAPDLASNLNPVTGLPAYLYFNSPSDLMNPGRQAMPRSFYPVGAVIPNSSPAMVAQQPGCGVGPYQFGAIIPGSNPAAIDGQADWFGDDIVLSDVISFNVRILVKDNTGLYAVAVPSNAGMLGSNQGAQAWPATNLPDFMDVPAANASYAPSPPASGPYSLPATFPLLALGGSATYNTGNYLWPQQLPPYSIQALEITIRIWDLKTARSRQITIVQDM